MICNQRLRDRRCVVLLTYSSKFGGSALKWGILHWSAKSEAWGGSHGETSVLCAFIVEDSLYYCWPWSSVTRDRLLTVGGLTNLPPEERVFVLHAFGSCHDLQRRSKLAINMTQTLNIFGNLPDTIDRRHWSIPYPITQWLESPITIIASNDVLLLQFSSLLYSI